MWPVPRNEAELMRFVNGLPFLNIYIPGRADLTRILKEAVIYEGKGKRNTYPIFSGLNASKSLGMRKEFVN